MNKLEQLELKQKELIKQQNEIAKMIHDLKGNEEWIPKIDETYYYITHFGKVHAAINIDTYGDEWCIGQRNCFKTKEQAEEYRENIKTKIELKALADELNGSEVIDWNDTLQSKFYIFYKHNIDTLDFYTASIYQPQGCIYCLNRNFFNEAIKRIGAQRLINMIKSGV